MCFACVKNYIKNTFNTNQKKRSKILTNYERFLQKEVPIIMVMGPRHCGKTTISEMLRSCSQFTLLSVRELLHSEVARKTVYGDRIAPYLARQLPVPDQLIVKLLKEEIVSTYITKKGFIIDGFPMNLRQAVYFKHHVRRPDCIVYMYLSLDALFARMIAKEGAVDLDQMRVKFIKDLRQTEIVYSKFDYITFKTFDSYPPANTCNRIIEHLEDNYGFKLIRMDV